MTQWTIRYLPKVYGDWEKLDNSVKKPVRNRIVNRLATNPDEHGEPLDNRHGRNLTGLRRLKFRKLGVRVVYRVLQSEHVVEVIAIGPRADDEVYRVAESRIRGS